MPSRSLAIAYALKVAEADPVDGLIDPKVLIEGGRNTIVYEGEGRSRRSVQVVCQNHSSESSAQSLRDLLCCLPRLDAPGDIGYRNIFRVLIMQFIDAYSFDVRSVKKTCVHIVHPDGRLIPFDTYNLFYRDGLDSPARAAQAVVGTVDARGDVMRRVLTVALIATLTTMMIGVEQNVMARAGPRSGQAGEAAGRGHEGPRPDEPGLRHNRSRTEWKMDVVIEGDHPGLSHRHASGEGPRGDGDDPHLGHREGSRRPA